MSHSTYAKGWHDAQGQLCDLLLQEIPPEPPKPEKDRVAAFQLLATMYIKYIQTFRRLEECYDQIVHPQKRRVLRHVLDGVIGRVLEIKNEMVNLEYSEFHYFDDVLSDLKLTPNDVEMPIPRYFVSERAKALKEREKLLGQILAKIGPQEKDTEKKEVKLTTEDAIRVVQVMERARQGRLRATFMREIRQREERERIAASLGAPTLDPDVAAISIQKIWKGYSQRKRTKKLRDDELTFVGMTPPDAPSNVKNTPQAMASKVEGLRHVTQETHEQEFQQALITIKEKIRETEGPDMMETMQDQIRQWFIECRDATGKFPEYPEKDDGGSALIFKEKDPAELEKELKEKDDDKGKGKGKKDKKEKKEKKGKKDKKDKKGKKGKDDDEEEEGWKMAPSNFVPTVNEGSNTFKAVWQFRSEKENFSQKHDSELIKEEKRIEVEEEIRMQVDELMRTELTNLKMAVDRDKGKKGKSGKKKGKKGKKSGKKGKKGKKEKDLTPDRDMDDLYEELVTEGIIVRPPKVHMQDFIGEYNYLGTTLRQASIEPMPSLSDIRRVITEFAILPLGSSAAHEKSPLIKSMLIAGSCGTGKKMLVHAICNETGANMFDLSPANLVGKYPGKDGLKMLMHLIYKVGRAYQPSVFFMGDCERMFKKKVPKTDPTDPKRLKKELPKSLKTIKPEDRLMLIGTTRCPFEAEINENYTDPKRLKKELPKSLKTIKPEDRLMLIGTTRCPFEAEIKPLTSCYQKIILIPRPDYASRHLLWRRLINQSGGTLSANLDISSLSKITDGYTPGHMSTVLSQVLSERRVQQLPKKPLQALEFISSLSRLDPVFKDEEEAFKEWYKKTPLGKKRAKAAQGDDEDGGGGKGGKKGGKKSGKKGKKGKKKK